jgi:uncharacterized repeat protein (TIGR03847 family)
MSTSFELHPERFVAGTVGEPGERVFFLQATGTDHVVTLRLEKQQVAALAEYLAGILADLPPAEEATAEADLREPVAAEWVVGSLAVAYEESEDRVLVVAEELVPQVDEPEELRVEGPASARFHLTRGQVAFFVRQAVELVLSGRPPCPLCGHPLDPDGHVCPKSNGRHAP